jgi:hypothetical protein
MQINKFTKMLALSSSLLVLASCGSSSGSGGPTPPGGNHIFGVFKGATDGASCSVTDANGTYAVPTKTADTGLTTVVSTTMSLAQGVVVLECSSGQYVDEATNNTLPGITMRASTNYPGSGPLILVASPLSEIAYRRAAERGLDANGLPSATNVGAMNTDVADEFGLTKVGGNLATTIPPNIMDGSSTPDNDAEGQLAVALAAVSQMAKDGAGGAASVSDLIDGIQQDMETGGMDTTTYSVEAALGSLTGTASSAIANGTVDTSTIVADAGDTDGGDGSATSVIDITGATLSYTPTADVVGTVGVAITEISPVLSTGSASVYSIDSLPSGLTISATTGVISGTPTATQTATIYTITAENTAGSTTGTISITINAAPPAGSAPSISVNTGAPLVGTVSSVITPVTFTNSGDAITSCSINPTINGLSVNNTTCEITGTPTATMAATVITVTAVNGIGNSVATFSATVNAAPPAGSAPSISVNTGAPLVGTVSSVITPVTFTNSGDAITSCSINPTINGLSVNNTTCEITGTPTATMAATVITVTAVNGIGNSVATFSATVNAAPANITAAAASSDASAATITLTIDNAVAGSIAVSEFSVATNATNTLTVGSVSTSGTSIYVGLSRPVVYNASGAMAAGGAGGELITITFTNSQGSNVVNTSSATVDTTGISYTEECAQCVLDADGCPF